MKPGRPLAPIEPALAEASTFVEATWEALLPKPAGPEARLMEAMRYATSGGGMRLGAFLLLQSGRLFGVDRRALGRVAAAVECVQACSAVHEELSAPERGGTRRDRARLDRAFDPPTAILAGDALLTLAFGLIASPEAHGDPFIRCELISRLAAAVGYGGMAGGKIMDLSWQGRHPELPEITRLARLKTAALMTFCCEAGAIMGKASASPRQAVAAYGQELGLASQIMDDLLAADAAATEEIFDKTARPTIVSLLGRERARAHAEALVGQAAAHLDLFDEKADLLRAAAQFVVARGA
jgi:farnesyl diphosphate synthase